MTGIKATQTRGHKPCGDVPVSRVSQSSRSRGEEQRWGQESPPIPIVPSQTSAPPGPIHATSGMNLCLGHSKGHPDGACCLLTAGLAADGHPDPKTQGPSCAFSPWGVGVTAVGCGAGLRDEPGVERPQVRDSSRARALRTPAAPGHTGEAGEESLNPTCSQPDPQPAANPTPNLQHKVPAAASRSGSPTPKLTLIHFFP